MKDEKDKLIDLLEEYIELLAKAESNALSIATIHHYEVSDRDIKKGESIRDKILLQKIIVYPFANPDNKFIDINDLEEL